MDQRVSTRGVEPADTTDRNGSFVDGDASGFQNVSSDTTSQPAPGDLSTSATDEEAVLRRAATELAGRKSGSRLLSVLQPDGAAESDSLDQISNSLSDPATTLRSAAVRTLYRLNPEIAATFLNKVISESTPAQRRRMGAALVGSGLLNDIPTASEDARVFYSARSLLFLLAKIGEVEPLQDILQRHPDLELRLALIKTLGQSEGPEVTTAFQQLLLDPSQPKEIRSIVMELLVQLVDHETSDRRNHAKRQEKDSTGLGDSHRSWALPLQDHSAANDA
ncbi:MAG TPA: hypothetical protein VJ023_10840 [Pyrinomonadaceae bacterium]|nr:hypothetical protein [Pyrinomonadaceae bacterium]